jgi:bloom syndrome protein
MLYNSNINTNIINNIVILLGINAVYMSSLQDDVEARGVYSQLARYGTLNNPENEVKMLYITPERYSKSSALKGILNKLNDKGNLSRFVIDEAHCVSSWGHDFRPDYLVLANLRNDFSNVPIMALTATGTIQISL